MIRATFRRNRHRGIGTHCHKHMSNRRRPTLLALLTAGMVLAALASAGTSLVATADASDGGGYTLLATFGSGVVNGPLFVAVDDSGSANAGDVWVGDRGDNTARLFTPDGSRVLETITGPPDGAFQELAGLAVDDSATATAGDVYISDQALGIVAIFNPNGTYVRDITEANIPTADQGPSAFAPLGVTVNAANGNVYVLDGDNDLLDEFTSSGAFVMQMGRGDLGTGSAASGPPFPVNDAVDAEGNVYVATLNTSLLEFSPTGECLNACASIDSSGGSTASRSIRPPARCLATTRA